MTSETSPRLADLVARVASNLDVSAETALGFAVAVAFRWEARPQGLFISGVPADVVDRIAATFGAQAVTPSEATPGDDAISIAGEDWSGDGPDAIGTGPTLASDRHDHATSITLALDPAPELSTLEAVQKLRTHLRTASEQLGIDLEVDPDVAALAAAYSAAPDATAAVIGDLATSRRLAGRYLLDAGDLYDDERIDQLGDGYVRAAALWETVATQPEKELVADVIALERACLEWMRGAAEPGTRYAF